MRHHPVRMFLPALALCMGLAAATFADPGDLSVSVKELAGGKAMSGVKLTVRTGQARGDYFSGDDGTAIIPIPDNAPYVMIAATSDGWVPVTQVWNQQGIAGKHPDKFELLMEKAVGIGGTLVDQAGAPLAGGKVFCIVQKTYPNGQRLGASWTSATVDAEGKWTFAGVPESFDKIQLGAYHKDCLGTEGFYALEDFADHDGLKKGTAVLKLTRGTPVTITVTDQAGKPVRNARVGYGADRVATNVYPEEKTNAKGVATMGIVPRATATITVQAKGHAPELVQVTIGTTAQAVNITLTAGHTLEGTVTDSNGDAAAGATVYVDTWRNSRTLNKSIKVDGEGHFVWTEAPADEVKVDVLTNHGEKRGVVMKAGGENKVALTPPTPFKGTVVDGETGKAVTAYSVALGIGFDEQRPISWEMGTQSMREVHLDGGSFDVLFSHPYPSRAVRVIADGYLPSDSPRFPLDGKEQAFTFKLEKGVPIRGTVKGADGKPVEGVQVALVSAGNMLEIQQGVLPQWAARNVLTTKTQADSAFSFPPQREEFLLVAVGDAGFGQVTKAELAKDATITLAGWGRLEGVARTGDKPRAHAEVRAEKNDFSAWQETAPHLSMDATTKTDADGKFVIERLAPGHWTLGHLVPQGRFSVSRTEGAVDIASGETAKLTLGGAGRAITGHVAVTPEVTAGTWQLSNCELMPAGQPKFEEPLESFIVPGGDRRAWYRKYQESEEGKKRTALMRDWYEKHPMLPFTVNSDGTFRITDVPAGTYSVNIPAYVSDSTSQQKYVGNFQGAAVVVPSLTSPPSAEPIDAGTLTFSPMKQPTAMDTLPEVRGKTLAGAEWNLADQKDKLVLIYFWTAAQDDAASHVDAFKKIWQSVGKDERFTMIGFCIDKDLAAAGKFAADHGIEWPVGQLSPETAINLLSRFDNNGFPAAMLVRNGKSVAQDIAPDALALEIDKTLKK